MTQENPDIKIARLEERVFAMQEALSLAKEHLKDYKAEANEWRGENIDQRRLFVTIEKHEGDYKTLEIKFDAAFKTVKIMIVTTGLSLAALLITLLTYLK